MKNYLMGYNEGDDVANKFRNVILEDGKNRDVNMLYKLKSECFVLIRRLKFDTIFFR